MTVSRYVVFVLIISLMSAHPQPTVAEEPAQKDIRLAQGPWTVHSVFKNGKRLDKDSRKGEKNAFALRNELLYEVHIEDRDIFLLLNSNGYKYENDKYDLISGHLLINASANPKTCDVVYEKYLQMSGVSNGSDMSKFKPTLCIYEITDEELIVCFSEANVENKPRPKNLGKNIDELEKDVVKFVFRKGSAKR